MKLSYEEAMKFLKGVRALGPVNMEAEIPTDPLEAIEAEHTKLTDALEAAYGALLHQGRTKFHATIPLIEDALGIKNGN